MKVLIPTCLDPEQIAPQIAAIREHTSGAEVFASCLDASASVNRNACLDQIAVGDTAIMVDDDVEGWYVGWADDLLLGLRFPGTVMVSARLLKLNGNFGQTSSDCYDAAPEEIPVKMLPSAAIAFRYTGLKFDCGYVGSGFEDTDYVRQLLAGDPSAVLVQSNRCRLIHRNEQKQQRGENWDHNRAYFRKKWGA